MKLNEQGKAPSYLLKKKKNPIKMALSFLNLLAVVEESLQVPFLSLPTPMPAAGSAASAQPWGGHGRLREGTLQPPGNHRVPSPGEHRGPCTGGLQHRHQ